MKTIAAASACLAAFTLAGCGGHTHSLIKEDSDREITVGTFHHAGNEEPAMALEFEGVRYEAKGFVINRKQNLAELKRRYDDRHYSRIFSGLDTDHYAYSAEPVLRAGNGKTLRCLAAWRANDSPAGHCVTGDGIHINFRFE